ncbi:MAG: alpha/beta fold hydrolase [Jatrophihabitantaceae bacterium]
MTSQPTLHISRPDGDAVAAVLVLHGGREVSTAQVRAGNLAAARMLPFARSLRRHGSRHGLVVARLRYAVRGWNGDDRSPVADARWALAQLADEFGAVPVALVGHSMGGRTALHIAGNPNVRSLVGLAPWIEKDDPVGTVTDRRVLLVHGDQDRVTNPTATARYAAAAAGRAQSVGSVTVHGDKHAMLSHPHDWHALTTGFVLSTVCGVPPEGTGSAALTNVLLKVLAGDVAVVM